MGLGWFSTFWSVEHDPERQVAREVFKAMYRAGCSEEYVGWSKHLPRFAADKFARSCRNKIDLIARVWLLWIDAARSIDFNQQTAMLENSRETLAFGTGQTFERFSHSCRDTRVV